MLFEEHHGEILYPSDVAEELSLDYDLVVKLLTELQDEGKIAYAEPNNGIDDENATDPRNKTRR
jgi:hypothetical protein